MFSYALKVPDSHFQFYLCLPCFSLVRKWWLLQLQASHSHAAIASEEQKHLGVKGFHTLHCLTGKRWFTYSVFQRTEVGRNKKAFFRTVLQGENVSQGHQGKFPFVNLWSHGWALHQWQGVKRLPKLAKPIRTHPLSPGTWLPR